MQQCQRTTSSPLIVFQTHAERERIVYTAYRANPVYSDRNLAQPALFSKQQGRAMVNIACLLFVMGYHQTEKELIDDSESGVCKRAIVNIVRLHTPVIFQGLFPVAAPISATT